MLVCGDNDHISAHSSLAFYITLKGISVIEALGGKVVECACVVELKMFIDPPADSGMPNRTKHVTTLSNARTHARTCSRACTRAYIHRSATT